MKHFVQLKTEKYIQSIDCYDNSFVQALELLHQKQMMKESGEKQQSDEIQAVGKKRAWGHHTVLISFHTLRHFAHRLGPLSTNPVAPQYVAQQI